MNCIDAIKRFVYWNIIIIFYLTCIYILNGYLVFSPYFYIAYNYYYFSLVCLYFGLKYQSTLQSFILTKNLNCKHLYFLQEMQLFCCCFFSFKSSCCSSATSGDSDYARVWLILSVNCYAKEIVYVFTTCRLVHADRCNHKDWLSRAEHM